MDPLDLAVLPLVLSTKDPKLRRYVLKQFEKSGEDISSSSLTQEEKVEVIEMTKRITKNSLLFFTSQELILWLKTMANEFSFNELSELVKTKIAPYNFSLMHT